MAKSRRGNESDRHLYGVGSEGQREEGEGDVSNYEDVRVARMTVGGQV